MSRLARILPILVLALWNTTATQFLWIGRAATLGADR